MPLRFALLLPLSLVPCAFDGTARAEVPTPILLLTAADPSPLVDQTARELGQSSRFQVIPLAAIAPLLRQRDAENGVAPRLAALREASHQALLSLADEQAARQLDQALTLAYDAFVRFYDPAALAQLHLLRAIAALNQARPDLARDDFRRARQLDSRFTLDAHYSPQVRAAFEEALTHGPPTSDPPSTAELTRLLALQPQARAVLVLAADRPQPGTLLIKGLLLERGGSRLTLAEADSIGVEPADSAQRQARSFGAKLRGWLEARLAPTVLRVLSPSPRSATHEGKRAWYRRWYVWAAAALVVGGVATAVPLALRREVVALDVRW